MAGTIRKHLGAEIARQAKDPRLATVYVEAIDISSDLGLIRVGVRALGVDDESGRRGVMSALGKMAKGLRASLGPVLRMRRMPELKFFYDQGQEHRARIDAVLAEIEQEDRARAAAASQANDGNEPEKA